MKKIKLKPSIYLSEEGNRLRECSPFKVGLVDEYKLITILRLKSLICKVL